MKITDMSQKPGERDQVLGALERPRRRAAEAAGLHAGEREAAELDELGPPEAERDLEGGDRLWHLEAQRVLAPFVALDARQRAVDDAALGVAGPQPQRRRLATDTPPGAQLHPLPTQRRRVERPGQPAPRADLGVRGGESQPAAPIGPGDPARRHPGPAQRPALQRELPAKAVLAGRVDRPADLAGQLGRDRRPRLGAHAAQRQHSEREEAPPIACAHHPTSTP
jgi:hypothetical protein